MAGIIGGQACADPSQCTVQGCLTTARDSGGARVMEFFGQNFWVKQVSCLKSASGDYRSSILELASDHKLVALAVGNPQINAISGLGAASNGQERWADLDHFADEFKVILAAFQPSLTLARLVKTVIEQHLEGGAFAAAHWRRGDRGHPEMGKLMTARILRECLVRRLHLSF
eukprot:174635-Rhodomonas_salina.2